MYDILSSIPFLLFIVWIYATLWFCIALLARRNDVADIAWGIVAIVITLCALFFHGIFSSLQLLITACVILWGVRLAVHIGTRMKGKKEDYRYTQWRNEWGKWFYLRTYGQVFLLQGLIALLVTSPVIIAMAAPDSNQLSWNVWIGLFLWIYGFFFETIGDIQLRLFIRNPENAGKIMMSGLWKYTRHPNYFGEVIQWWGLWVMILAVPFGFFGIIGPLTITYTILFVSGIPMLEKKYEKNSVFQEYKRKTSSFFPWFPKK